MAVSFSVPASPSRSVLTIDEFLGADFTNSPASADINKSPNCINMIRDVPGKVRKCMGYETVKTFNEDNVYINGYLLNGYFKIDGSTKNFTKTNFTGIDFKAEEFYLTPGELETQSHQYFSFYIPSAVGNLRSHAVAYLDLYEYDTTEDKHQEIYRRIFESYRDTKIYFIDAYWGGSPGLDYVGIDEDYFDITENVTFDSNFDRAYGIRKVTLQSGDPEYHLFIAVCADLSHYTTRDAWYDFPDGSSRYEAIFGQFSDGEIESVNVNGFHKLRTDEYGVFHIGNCFIRNDVLLYDQANDARSKSWEFNEKLYIVDGKKLLCYGVTEPKSDTKFKADKETNEIVVDDEVTLIIYRYAKKQYDLKITAKSTTSANGKFAVGKDKRTITYTDKLTTVGQEISYSCSWKAKKSSSASYVSKSITTHKLKAISDEGEYEVNPVEDDAYVPTITISRDPDGGGQPQDDLNLLTPAFTEEFLGQAGVKDYCMSFTDLDEVEPIARVLDSNGNWNELIYGTEYTCNYETGVITFAVAPGESPVGGHDNVSITAYRTVERYKDRINNCTIGALYGVNGALDRLFLSGNPDYINYDWYSKDRDPTYFADTSYSVLGSSSSAIIGYSVISNYLAAHKDRYERDQNIILREGDMVDSEPSFRIINTLQGAGAVAPFSFAYLATEPMFLTEQGVYAVTAQDITGEKYAQDRSFFLNGRLLKEENLKDAYACVFNDMYWLCLNDVAYILDGLQPIRTDKAEPYATRQYVGFYRTNLPARVMWEDGGRLYFGTEDGKICRFFSEKYSNQSYNDNGVAIEANWETPDIIGKVFFKNKTLRHIAVKLDSSIATSVKIYVMNRGLYNFVKEDERIRELWEFITENVSGARYFTFAGLIFSKLTFSNDQTQHTLPTKVRVKKVDKFRLKLVNDSLNEPFGLFDIGFEYVEKGNYKG